ncbi:MAG: alpha/beta family hydrolase [Ilumatobacteraceae bacterium]
MVAKKSGQASGTSSMPTGVVLLPGSGSGRDHSSLIAIEDALSPMPVGRYDFDYRMAGKRAPDRPPKLLARVRECARSFAAEHGTTTGRLVLGGRSMGGRICSMVAAGVPDIDGEDALPVRGLVLVSYPLHPPAKPENLRVEHLPRITVPCLFVHGTKDDFGSPDELQRWTATIPSAVTHHFIENGRHELKNKDAMIADIIADWLSSLD